MFESINQSIILSLISGREHVSARHVLLPQIRVKRTRRLIKLDTPDAVRAVKECPVQCSETTTLSTQRLIPAAPIADAHTYFCVRPWWLLSRVRMTAFGVHGISWSGPRIEGFHDNLPALLNRRSIPLLVLLAYLGSTRAGSTVACACTTVHAMRLTGRVVCVPYV